MTELLLYSKNAAGEEVECLFRHAVDFKEALSSGKYYRKGEAVEDGRAPDVLDIDTMTLEQLNQLAEYERIIGWRGMDRVTLTKALKDRRKPAAKAKGK